MQRSTFHERSPVIELSLSPEEFNALTGLLDAGVKAAGLQAITPAFYSVIGKLADAAKAANAKPEAKEAP